MFYSVKPQLSGFLVNLLFRKIFGFLTNFLNWKLYPLLKIFNFSCLCYLKKNLFASLLKFFCILNRFSKLKKKKKQQNSVNNT